MQCRLLAQTIIRTLILIPLWLVLFIWVCCMKISWQIFVSSFRMKRTIIFSYQSNVRLSQWKSVEQMDCSQKYSRMIFVSRPHGTGFSFVRFICWNRQHSINYSRFIKNLTKVLMKRFIMFAIPLLRVINNIWIKMGINLNICDD